MKKEFRSRRIGRLSQPLSETVWKGQFLHKVHNDQDRHVRHGIHPTLPIFRLLVTRSISRISEGEGGTSHTKEKRYKKEKLPRGRSMGPYLSRFSSDSLPGLSSLRGRD